MSVLDEKHINYALNKARAANGQKSIRILIDELYDESVWLWECFDDFLQDFLSDPNSADYDLVMSWYFTSGIQSSTGDCNDDFNGDYVT